MKRLSIGTFIPVLLLTLMLAVLGFTSAYALSLKPVSESPQEVIYPAETASSDQIVRTSSSSVLPVSEPEETIAPMPADESSEPDNGGLADVPPFWMHGSLFIGDEYRSPTLSVKVTVHNDSHEFGRRIMYYVADIHVRDVTQIRTVATHKDFSKARRGRVREMAKGVDALIAISGDYCAARKDSLIIRNGVVYRSKLDDGDVCLLLKNGEMQTIQRKDANLKSILKKDPWQAWQFGPALLDSKGNAIKSFPGSKIRSLNPRCSIGYVEPGHYFFVVVDGRQKDSKGVTLAELAVLMKSLGCRQAYNLDGGASAHMYWKGTIFSDPSGGGRKISDIIYIAKEPYPSSQFYCGKEGK